MKKWAFLLVVSLSMIFMVHGQPIPMTSQEPESTAQLKSKLILENTEGYFVLSDGSCWKVIGFSKRERTLSEWWCNVELAPEDYNTLPKDWVLGSQIEIYSKQKNLSVKESNASNQERLALCTHLFFNKETRQVLFAIALEPEELLINVFKEASKDGYIKGYDQGHMYGKKLSFSKYYTEIYDKGYCEGYKKGYEDSHQNSKEKISRRVDE